MAESILSGEAAPVVAIYGAVVATLVAGWTIYRGITDRGALRVQVVNMDMVQGGVTIAKDRLWVKVTNVGRQPIYLDRIGGRYRKGAPRSHFLIVTAQSLPVKLEPGESFGDYSSDSTAHDFTR